MPKLSPTNCLETALAPMVVDDVGSGFEEITMDCPPRQGMVVAPGYVLAEVLGKTIMEKYAADVGFSTTYHCETGSKDNQGRVRTMQIGCVQGGKPRNTGKVADPEVNTNACYHK